MSAEVRRDRWHGADAVTLADGDLAATFLPQVGLLGVALTYAGAELLALPGGLASWRGRHTTGLALLHPWANRLGGWAYEAAGLEVDLSGLPLHDDGAGHPMHGTMLGALRWELDVAGVDGNGALLRARYRYGDDELERAAFPFPHLLTVEARLAQQRLVVTTTVAPTTDRPVPVSFGWHPYLALPTLPRDRWMLHLPERTLVTAGPDGLPTGEERALAAETAVVGARRPDDLFRLSSDRRFWLQAGRHRLTLDLLDGYDHAQVFVPASKRAVCLEPMTAPANALVTGAASLVAAGSAYLAGFALTPSRGGQDAPDPFGLRLIRPA